MFRFLKVISLMFGTAVLYQMALQHAVKDGVVKFNDDGSVVLAGNWFDIARGKKGM